MTRLHPDYGALVIAACCMFGGMLMLAQGAYDGVVGLVIGGLFGLAAFRER